MLEFSIPMLNLICVYTGQHFAEVSYSKKTAVAAMIWTYKCEDTHYSSCFLYLMCKILPNKIIRLLTVVQVRDLHVKQLRLGWTGVSVQSCLLLKGPRY